MNRKSKLINFIQAKNYTSALYQLKKMQQTDGDNLSTSLIQIFCKIENKNYKSAQIEINKVTKKNHKHDLLNKVQEHLNKIKSGEKSTNPLIPYVKAYIDFENSPITQNPKQFDKILYHITEKSRTK